MHLFAQFPLLADALKIPVNSVGALPSMLDLNQGGTGFSVPQTVMASVTTGDNIYIDCDGYKQDSPAR
jgi:hypothetical protein